MRFNWKMPTTRESGRPQRIEDLAGYDLRMKVEGAPDFVSVYEPGPADTTCVLDITDVGTYEFELYAVGKNGKTSLAPARASFVIPDVSAPGTPGEFLVTLV